jgi:Glyoxalase-like domain
MKNHLGIDHPLVAVRNLDKACEDFARLGFYINPRHHHPWGTDNHLLMFPESFIELISVFDRSKLDLASANGVAFGRFISNSLERREGMAMVALHSEDARADYRLIEERALENQGIIDFRRIAHRADGSEEEAVVSLVMLLDSRNPPLSHFLCHQHKPHLVWVAEWMSHPNAADGIEAVVYVARDPELLMPRFIGIYGESAVTNALGQVTVQTARGVFEILSVPVAKQRFSGVSLPVTDDQLPCGVAIRVSTADIDAARRVLQGNAVEFVEDTAGVLRIPAEYAGNTILEFVSNDN